MRDTSGKAVPGPMSRQERGRLGGIKAWELLPDPADRTARTANGRAAAAAAAPSAAQRRARERDVIADYVAAAVRRAPALSRRQRDALVVLLSPPADG